MSKLLDLSGQRFGMIAVTSRAGMHPTRKLSTWNCRCDCGIEFVAVGPDLKRLKNQNCGCRRTSLQPKNKLPSVRRVNLIGEKFGKLTVLSYDHKNSNNQLYWLCQCDCGNQKIIRGGALKNGNTKSCGCAKLNAYTKRRDLQGKFIGYGEDLAGQRFGYLTVSRPDTERPMSGCGKYWLCQCDCGTLKSVAKNDLKRGHTKSCGCMRHELWKKSSSTYKGDRNLNKSGYATLLGYKGHPNANEHGRIFEHVLVMSEILGRPLVKGESVHHKNGIRDDNRPENLELWVKRQPAGQRVNDRIADAVNILKTYAPHLLNDVAAYEFILEGENTIDQI